jgi:hypothetical protein
MTQKEMAQEDKKTWKTNGLNHVEYKLLKQTQLGKDVVMYSVDIGE